MKFFKYVSLSVALFFAMLMANCLLMLIGLRDLDTVHIPSVPYGTEAYEEAKEVIIYDDLGPLTLFLFSFAVCAFFLKLYRRFSRDNRPAPEELAVDVKGPFILYLRSFKDDSTTSKFMSSTDLRTEEEMLVSTLGDIAPVYAVGAPSDKVMPYGAKRIYLTDEIWKETVHNLAMKAQLVVLRLGKTDSFWWEVKTALTNVAIDKIVFVIPWSKDRSNIDNLLNILEEHNIDVSKAKLSSIKKRAVGSISSVIYFDAAGNLIINEVETPRFVGVFMSYDNMLRNALSGVRERYGFKPCKKSVIRRARIFSVLLLLSLTMSTIGRMMQHLAELKLASIEFLR